MKSLALTLAVFFCLYGRFADAMPVPKNASPPAPDAGQFTSAAKRPPVNKQTYRYSISAIAQKPFARFRTTIMTHQDAKGHISSALSHPFLRDTLPSKRLPSFPPLPGYQYVESVDKNQRGQIVGSLTYSGSGAWLVVREHGFLRQNGKTHDLGALPGYQISHATAINNQGIIVGDSVISSFPADMDIPGHAVCWIRGEIRDLGEGIATAINDLGDIVGNSGTGKADGSHDPHASLWTHGCRYDLNDLIPKNSGWTLTEAHATNDRGQIAGSGTLNGKPLAFLLTPR